MCITIEKINPYVRMAGIQPAVLEGGSFRIAYDGRIFCVLESGGTVFIDDLHYEIQKGTIIFIPQGSGYYFKGKMRVAVINFDMTRNCDNRQKPIAPPPKAEYDSSLIFDKAEVEGFLTPIVVNDADFLVADAMKIVTDFQRGGIYSDALVSGGLKSLLTNILQYNTGKTTEAHIASLVQGYIQMYACEIKSNSEIARHFGYHPVYIATVFKSETGKSLHSEIMQVRINTACRYLMQTDLSVEDIAINTGFSSRSHFCTVFKKYIGSTPLKWRSKEKR